MSKDKTPIPKKDFIAMELLRMVSMIPETDPRSSAYRELLTNIECFGAAATMFDDLWAIFGSYFEDHGVHMEGYEPQIVKPEFKVVTSEEDPPSEEAPVSEEPDSPIQEEEPMFEEAPPEEPVEETPEYDAATVKKALAKARADGKLLKIKEWLVDNFGVEGFSALPAAKYGEVMTKLHELGASV